MDRPPDPICQSCAMPLRSAVDYGTNADGTHHDLYCRFCYQHGAFMNPTATPMSMIQLCAQLLSARGVPFAEAQALMMQTIPHLKRWRAGAPADRVSA